MEIFQTIWTALTTENVELIKIFTILFSILEGYLSMLLITAFLNLSVSKKQRILYVVTLSCCGYLTKFIIPNPYNTFINIIMFFIAGVLIFKLNVFKGLLALIIPFVITISLETIISAIYPKLFSIDYYIGMNIPLHRIIGTFFIYFMEFLIYIFAKNFRINLSNFKITNLRKRILLIFNIILGLILIASQLYVLSFFSSTLPFMITLLNLFGLLIYFLLSLYIIFTISKLETTSTSLEEAQLYNKTLQILHDNIRAFKHDFWNIVQGIGGYISKNDMDGLKNYYSKLVEDCQQVNNLTALSPSVVNNPAIYNILANKYHIADELGIKIGLEVFMDLTNLNINSYELTRILGILMNNAIEASKECEEKIINVTFRKDKRRHLQLVIVENTYKDKDVDTEKIYEKGYSTKPGNTGIGLWEVRQIMRKHNNLNLYTTKTDDYFSQQFEIYY